jgi:signal peptidase I
MKLTKKKIEIFIVVAVLVAAALPAFVAQTGTYPLTIIDGASMYPTLQNGDMVYYHSVANKNTIPNGTVIVFVQGNSGFSMFDGLVRPVVIHRVVGQVVADDGTVNYVTKGDNNDVNDPFLTRADHVLGVQGQQIPMVGLFILFLKSPQGLIATVGIITLTYLSMYDIRRRREKSKEKLLGSLAKKVLNGYMSEKQFKKLELAVKYSEEVEGGGLKDRSILALADWMRNGGLDENWKMRVVTCPACFHIAVGIQGSKDNSVRICSYCNDVKTWDTTLMLNEENLNNVLAESIDEAFSSLGERAKAALYRHLEKDFSLKRKEIPCKLEDLNFASEKIFGDSAKKLDLLIVNTFKKNLLFICRVDPKSATLQEFVKRVKENIEQIEKDLPPQDNVAITVADAEAALCTEVIAQK